MKEFKTCYGIRHIRYYWYRWRVQVWAYKWYLLGVGFGYPNQLDLEYLDKIWRGEC